MRIRQSAIIFADASDIWPYVADPGLHATWNAKVVLVDRERSGPVHCGERFDMVYRMRGRDNQSHVEITAAEPPLRVAFIHRTAGRREERVVEESYELSPHGNGVKIVQTIDLTRAGIPWPVRLLIWFIDRFGWREEELCLQRLKHLLEQPATAGS